jgi:hypothetical protein
MPADIERTDPTTHPRFQREQRQITAMLVTILARRGRSETEAVREAEALLAPLPPGRQPSTRGTCARRASGE